MPPTSYKKYKERLSLAVLTEKKGIKMLSPYLFYYKNNLVYKSLPQSNRYSEYIRRRRSYYDAKTFSITTLKKVEKELTRLKSKRKAVLATLERAQVESVAATT